jgi:hypothetical protein
MSTLPVAVSLVARWEYRSIGSVGEEMCHSNSLYVLYIVVLLCNNWIIPECFPDFYRTHRYHPIYERELCLCRINFKIHCMYVNVKKIKKKTTTNWDYSRNNIWTNE